eukprot:c21422_g1_i1 orf=268-786(-)
MSSLHSLWILTRRLALAAVLGVTVSDKVGTVTFMDGPSMEPTLNSGSDDTFKFLKKDILWVETFFTPAYNFSRGDVVVLRSPEEPNEWLVKRLIALQGDWINVPGSYEILQVPKGRCWVEGDNGKQSLDSKTFGPIPLALVKGRATHILWPPSRIGRIERILPAGRVISPWK